mgnify:CR=1 FL=1
MLWRTSPAATELEEVATGWLGRLLGLPDSFEGVINDSGSSSTFHALLAAREAARRIAGLGPTAVVIKGGHLIGPQAIDVLFFEGAFTEFPATRVHVADVHGTGCTFASAIAARLALGDDIPKAVDQAKRE